MQPSPTTTAPLASRKTLVFALVIAALGVLLAASAAANVVLYRKVQAFENDPQRTAAQETEQLIAEVRSLMVLPEETPTVATVTDPAKLQEQEFFRQAKVGDKVFIFSEARKAVLYDPVAKRIIEVAPLRAGTDAAPVTAPEETAKELPSRR